MIPPPMPKTTPTLCIAALCPITMAAPQIIECRPRFRHKDEQVRAENRLADIDNSESCFSSHQHEINQQGGPSTKMFS